MHPLPVGIVDQFYGFSSENFQFDCPHWIRSPQKTGPALAALLDAAPPSCHVLALVEAPDLDLVRAFARAGAEQIELGNELELKPYELTPEQYGQWITRAIAVLQDEGYTGTIVLGGVYAITPETKRAIVLGLVACMYANVNCVSAIHLYDASDEELAWLRWLTSTYKWLRIWVTEFGYPTRCQPARDAQQRDYLETQAARFSTVPRLERLFIYERENGPPGDCSDLGTFGIAGKPAADWFRNAPN